WDWKHLPLIKTATELRVSPSIKPQVLLETLSETLGVGPDFSHTVTPKPGDMNVAVGLAIGRFTRFDGPHFKPLLRAAQRDPSGAALEQETGRQLQKISAGLSAPAIIGWADTLARY